MRTLSERMAQFDGQPVTASYVIAYEASVDAPLTLQIPDPNWLAMALAGGVLPAVEAYHSKDRATIEAAPAIGPLSEEQAMEYLLQKDVPREIWDAPTSNRRRFIITRKNALPPTRQWRNAWRLSETLP
jgi:hypothetical protein